MDDWWEDTRNKCWSGSTCQNWSSFEMKISHSEIMPIPRSLIWCWLGDIDFKKNLKEEKRLFQNLEIFNMKRQGRNQKLLNTNFSLSNVVVFPLKKAAGIFSTEQSDTELSTLSKELQWHYKELRIHAWTKLVLAKSFTKFKYLRVDLATSTGALLC